MMLVITRNLLEGSFGAYRSKRGSTVVDMLSCGLFLPNSI